jgi:Zn-dependent protease/CBS domain-containing protein
MEYRMDNGIKLGRVWNVPITLHLSWFLIAGLITWSLATGYFPSAYPQVGPAAYWLLGAVTAVLFAASVLLHELGHVFVALRERIPVRGVTLFLFGGVAQITSEPRTPGAEFRIAIAGPLVSLALAAVFGLLFLLDRAVPFLAAPSEYLMRINFMLALFNLIPGFPLDGGRVLRAAVWKLTGSQFKATRAASVMGQLVAFGFIGVGVFTMIAGSFFNGLWLIFIGWFLQNAAASAYQHNAFEHSLRGITVSQVMRRDIEPVPTLMPLSTLVEERLLNQGSEAAAFIVSDGLENQGVITVEEIARVPRRQWPYTTARQIMLPFSSIRPVTPYMELMAAIREMEQRQVNQIAVMLDHNLVGMLNRDDVLRYLRLRADLKI